MTRDGVNLVDMLENIALRGIPVQDLKQEQKPEFSLAMKREVRVDVQNNESAQEHRKATQSLDSNLGH